MSQFIQLHLLTFYPSSNPNRDDTGRPKTAQIGGINRQRISSQCLKRTWRCSDLFQEALSGKIGKRTKRVGVMVYEALCDQGVDARKAFDYAREIAGQFGKLKAVEKKGKDEKKGAAAGKEELKSLEIDQLVHVSPEEWSAIKALVATLAREQRAPEAEELALLRQENSGVDIAMFGRMLASWPGYNKEAAVQVAHAFTVNNMLMEDDYFTAVDDLNDGSQDSGSAHLGNSEYGSGTYYKYVCINRDLLVENLGGDEALAGRALKALGECAVTLTPTGKKNSFANFARASYVLAEKGPQTPRSLALAFLQPITKGNQIGEAVERLQLQMKNMDKVYGDCAEARYELNADSGDGSLQEFLRFLEQK